MRWLLPILVLLLLAPTRVSPAAGPLSAVEAAVNRSEGARLRARVDRVKRLAQGDTQDDVIASVDAADRLLYELDVLRGDPGTLDEPTLEAVAREVIEARNAALLSLRPFGTGEHGRFLRSLVDAASFDDWALGVPASITLAQAVIESNWGRSAPGNALFGLKGTGTAGSVQRRVVEYKKGRRSKPVHAFRVYHTVDEAIADHSKLLATSRHYGPARAVSENPDAYARALQGVYASDPRYAEKLSGTMRRLDVLRFNIPSAAPYR